VSPWDKSSKTTVGRFAPSPTGPLHLGSLVAAVGSYLFARAAGGRWHVRIDDLDPPRVVAGAADAQLRALEAYGLSWDGEVVYQSARSEAYAAAMERLGEAGHTFPCACSRGDVAAAGGRYPGTCRTGISAGREARSVRLRVPAAPVCFTDRLCGEQRHGLAEGGGDFVVRRADGPVAYPLAVVVDDAAIGTTEVVRGGDLLAATGRQVWLYRCLGLDLPVYAHLPVVTTAAGAKLSKGSGAAPIPLTSPGREQTLFAALTHLGVADPAVGVAGVAEQLVAALACFDPRRIPTVEVQMPTRLATATVEGSRPARKEPS